MESEQISFDTIVKTEAEQLRDAVQGSISNKEQYGKFIEVVQNKSYIAVKAKNLLAVKVEPKKSGIRIEYRSIYDDKFPGHEVTHLDNDYSRVVVSSFNDVLALAPVLAAIAEAEVVIASDSFGCCSRYEACSNAKKCIHPNPIFAAACTYKKNLEQGRIFYGKNKNI